MYVTLDKFRSTWDQLKRESLSHSTCRVAVLVSCLDVDALCAAKMLDILLQKDLIPHKIVPVVGYENFKASYLALDADVRNVICVGCGSNVDLEEFLGLDDEDVEREPSTRPRLHILDNHRPWNLNNLFGSDQIVCYDDGYFENLGDIRVAYDFLAEAEDDNEAGASPADLNSNSPSLHPNDDTDDENANEAGPRARKRKVAVNSDTEEEDGSDGETSARPSRSQSKQQENEAKAEATQPDTVQAAAEGSSIANVSPGSLRQRAKRRRSQKVEFERQIETYYEQGSHVVSTDSVQVYTLLTMIGETSPRTLWLTIVGTTALEPQHPELYASLQPALRDEIRRISRDRDITARTSGTSNRDISFTTENDFSLFLLRQWSLYESMIHSSYLSAKLYLWKEDGRKTLHKMLARIGITLQDARESWVHMNPNLKRELKQKLDSVSGLYGIERICRKGVVRRFGLDGTISAGDCAEAIAALLEAGSPQPVMSSTTSTNQNDEEQPGPGEHPDEDNTVAQEFWVQNFWTAWDSVENFSRLRAGADQAKILQTAVVATGTAVFEKSIPKDLHTYRMVVIQDGPDLATFKNPLSLARLGVWISEGCAEIHSRTIPLVLAISDEPRGVYLVLGVGPHKSRDEEASASTVYNQFGRAFQMTSAKINARVRIDAFESAIIEVSTEDLPRFLQALDFELRSQQQATDSA